MQDAKALLDSLMGTSRNADLGEQRQRSFKDDDVCKFYLLGCCPNLLLEGSKAAPGVCSKVHLDDLLGQFNKSEEKDHYRKTWLPDLRRELVRHVADADRRVAQGRQRAARTAADRSARAEKASVVDPESLQKVKAIKDDIAALLKRAEDCASEGKLTESNKLIEQTKRLEAQIEDVAVPRAKDAFLRIDVCEICGAVVEVEDNLRLSHPDHPHRLGTVCRGYKAIREFYKKIEAEGVEKHRRDRSGSGSRRDKARSRSKKRERNRNGKDDRSRSRSARKHDRDKNEKDGSRSRSRSRRKDKVRKQREAEKEQEAERLREQEKIKKEKQKEREKEKEREKQKPRLSEKEKEMQQLAEQAKLIREAKREMEQQREREKQKEQEREKKKEKDREREEAKAKKEKDKARSLESKGEITVGAIVRLHGLESFAQWNGHSGEVQAWQEGGEWVVLLDDDETYAGLKPENLTLVKACSPSPDRVPK